MSAKYFSKLNYTLANEDTSLEWNLLPTGKPHVASIAGSGSRVVPLLARAPGQLSICDMAIEQLHLCELRFALIAAVDHATFLSFLGYPGRDCDAGERKRVFDNLSLSTEARKFFTDFFYHNGWKPILYHGKWEQTFAKIAAVNRFFTRQAGAGLFECTTLQAQQEYLAKHFPRKRWLAAVSVMGNASMFNALLYRGHFPEKNLPQSFFEFFSSRFDLLFERFLARDNFFLQLIFFGTLKYPSGLTTETNPGVFDAAKKALKSTTVSYHQGDALGHFDKNLRNVDFFSFSDVPSYFKGDDEKQFMQRLRPGLSRDANVVIRSYQHIPWRPDLRGYENITANFSEAIDQEQTQMYLVDVFRKDH